MAGHTQKLFFHKSTHATDFCVRHVLWHVALGNMQLGNNILESECAWTSKGEILKCPERAGRENYRKITGNLRFPLSRIELEHVSSMNFEDSDSNTRHHAHAEIKDEPWCQIKISCGISIKFWIPRNYVSCSWHPVVCVCSCPAALPSNLSDLFCVCFQWCLFVCSQQPNPVHYTQCRVKFLSEFITNGQSELKPELLIFYQDILWG